MTRLGKFEVVTNFRRFSRFPGRRGCVPVLLATITVFLIAWLAVPAVATPSASGLVGGGFVNVVTADSSQNLVAGGDVAGVYVSPSGQDNWAASNGDVTLPEQMSVASIEYGSPSTVYSAYGVKHQNKGGIAKSVDSGVTWTSVSTTLKFSGQGPNEGGPFVATPTDVRSTGNLIAFDNAHTKIYVGTYDQGLYRANAGTFEATPLVMGPGVCTGVGWSNCYIRTVVAQPDDLTTLWVGTYGNGLYKVTGANGTNATATPVSIGTCTCPHVEELAFDSSVPNQYLYCACGTDGIYRAAKPYNSWVQLSGIEAGPEWDAIAAGGGFVYAGAHNPANVGGVYRAVKKLPSSGSTTWTDIVTALGDPTICGTLTRWWIADADLGSYLLGGSRSDVAMLTVAGTKVYAAGRAGVWRYDTVGTTWCPSVKGMGLTAPKDIATSSVDDGRVYLGSTDWTFFNSSDHATTVTQQNMALPGATYGFSVAVDPNTGSVSDVYLGVGSGNNRDGQGEVYWSANGTPGTWTALNLIGQTVVGPCRNDAVGGRPLGLGVGQITGPTRAVVVAAVDGCGVWRWVGNYSGVGTWTQIKGPADLMDIQGGGFEKAPVSWPPGSQYVYVLDRYGVGMGGELWMSNNYGANPWRLIWNNISDLSPDLDVGTGYIAADPVVPTRLWVTTTTGVFVIPDTSAVTPCVVPVTNAPANPGPVAFRPASSSPVYIATRQGIPDAALYAGTGLNISGCTSATASWSPVADDAAYHGAAVFPRVLSVTRQVDGFAYVGTGGQGAVVVSGLP
jgi:hypothetical protein